MGSTTTININAPIIQNTMMVMPKHKKSREKTSDRADRDKSREGSLSCPRIETKEEQLDHINPLLPNSSHLFNKMISPMSVTSRRSQSSHMMSSGSGATGKYDIKQPDLLQLMPNFQKSQYVFSRQDVHLLQSWLLQQLENLANKGISKEERLNLTNTVYKIVMKELIKQVYVECKERGRLLELVWSKAMSLNSLENTKFTRSQQLLLEFEQNRSKELK